MIEYELAKQLKDKGFPLNKCDLEECYWDGGSFEDGTQVWHYPTLSELIDACGEEILGLHRTHSNDGTPNGWYADTHTHSCECGKPECNGS